MKILSDIINNKLKMTNLANSAQFSVYLITFKLQGLLNIKSYSLYFGATM